MNAPSNATIQGPFERTLTPSAIAFRASDTPPPSGNNANGHDGQKPALSNAMTNFDWQTLRHGKAPIWQYTLLGLSGLGLLFPKAALSTLYALPKAIINLPSTISRIQTTVLNLRPKAFLPYRSLMTDTPTTVMSPIDMRYRNMSFQDWATRTSILGVYFAQGVLAIQYRRRPVETWIRNAAAWYFAVQVMLYTKDPNTLYSWLMSQPIVPKKNAQELMKPASSFLGNLKNPRQYLDKVINPLRPKWNYLAWCERAGINLRELGVKESLKKAVHQSAYWNTLDVNELRLVDKYRQRLLRRGKLTQRPYFTQQAHQIERFMAKIVQLRLLSIGLVATATTLLVGVLVPKATIWIASPFDRYFEQPQRRFVMNPNQSNLKKSPSPKAKTQGEGATS